MISPHRYDPATIEPKWQNFWDEHQTFRTLSPGEAGFDASRPKYYVLDMFPYPSGAGLHVGHPEGYTATDILARYKRMKGFNVLHPMGWDAFGLPAEQYAIQTGTHPAVTTRANIKTFKRQIKALGFSYDWERELATTDDDYVRWTQWIFLLLWDTWYDTSTQKGRHIAELPIPAGLDSRAAERYVDSQRLAYIGEVAVWWCPELGTVLANEEVIDGRSERGSYVCQRQPLRQWMLRITAYADRLLQDLEFVDWPDETRRQQAEWIGQSHGAEVWFGVETDHPELTPDGDRLRHHDGRLQFKIFTTRPDTLYGVTFMVLSPEHSLVDHITTPEQRDAVHSYRRATASKGDLERTQNKDKSGVFTGGYALNPVSGERVPIWIADYVLSTYGTGAIMAVPGHDQRDYEFARQFDLEVREVIAGPDGPLDLATGKAYTGPGVAVNSPWIEGLSEVEAKANITQKLVDRGLGQAKTTYRLRDWIFSRQRYWGEPFPVLHLDDGSVVGVPDADLPVTLPPLDDFGPSGRPEPTLARAEDWVNTSIGGHAARRETNTMPNWAGSCWYYLRFLDPKNATVAWDRDMERYWMPVDLYVGGREHAVLHLLYARFWHKVLFDRGQVTHPEPFGKLYHQGLVLAFSYQDSATKVLVPSDQVEETAPGVYRHAVTHQPLNQVVAKMSKALKNVVNPDEIVKEYGADSLRLYEMFMGPLDVAKPWNSKDIGGVLRFLQRTFRLIMDEETGELRGDVRSSQGSPEIERALHRCIKKVGDDLERFAFNTCISAMMIFLNEASTKGAAPLSISQAERYVKLLAPFAPHVAEELWSKLGHPESLAYASWPTFDAAQLEGESIEMPVQINGKMRGKIVVPNTASNADMEAAARDFAASFLEGKSIKKVVVVPKRMVNLVVG